MTKFVTATALVFSLVLAACGGSTIQSGTLEPTDIFHRYQVAYDKTTDKTSVQADFFKEAPGGLALELTGSSQVSDNGKMLKRPRDFAPLYLVNYDGFEATHKFKFTHRDGFEEENTVPMRPIAPVAPVNAYSLEQMVLESMFRREYSGGLLRTVGEMEVIPAGAESHTFNWEGAPVGPNESVYLIVENANGRLEVAPKVTIQKDGKIVRTPVPPAPTGSATDEVTRTAKYIAVETPGAVGVTISKKDLEAIGFGARTYKFQRVTRGKLEQRLASSDAPKVRGSLVASYISESRPAVFVKPPEKKK